jgi:hypothetical protein
MYRDVVETQTLEGRPQRLHVDFGLAADVDPPQERDVSHGHASSRFRPPVPFADLVAQRARCARVWLDPPPGPSTGWLVRRKLDMGEGRHAETGKGGEARRREDLADGGSARCKTPTLVGRDDHGCHSGGDAE